uniref:Uncharacterized protein n=1 Tax=Tanacetum cinerariifolium TaxID=118510 RepID=A0A699HMX7_TANCI|nr:hypothetical protein [Tanacetum cinerariifolium]
MLNFDSVTSGLDCFDLNWIKWAIHSSFATPARMVDEEDVDINEEYLNENDPRNSIFLRREMAVEGTTSPHVVRILIDDYPFAVYGLEMWSAIKIMGDRKDESWWPKMHTHEELIEPCTIISSAFHTVVAMPLCNVIAINGKFSGPTINSTINNNVVVNVRKKLDEDLLFTWTDASKLHTERLVNELVNQ